MAQRPDNFTLNMSHPLASGLVFAGLGALPGSTRYHDSSAFGNHGTLTNMEPATDWVWDSTLNRMALNLDGVNEHVTTFAKAIDPFTVSWWGKQVVTGTYDVIFGWAGTFASLVVYSATGNISRLNTGGGYAGSWSAAWSDTAKWHHFAFTQNTTTGIELFRDGVSLGYIGTTSTAMAGFTIGQWYPYYASDNYSFKGMLGDPLVHNRIISNTEISLLADPSNVMLSGLILPPRRKWWPVVSGGTPAFKAAWAMRRRQTIGGGII